MILRESFIRFVNFVYYYRSKWSEVHIETKYSKTTVIVAVVAKNFAESIAD